MSARFLMPLVAVPLAVGLFAAASRPWQPIGAQVASIRVMTSITPLADLIKNVGADRVEVTALVPAGDDPEGYDPTPADAAALARAQVFFANGLGLEAYLEDLVEAAGKDDLEIITLSAGLPTLSGFGQGAEEGGNPHLWLNPRHAISYVETIREALTHLDPEGAASYSARASQYTNRLLELDAYIEQEMQLIPPQQRVLVSTHDALPYFAERYGLSYLGVISGNPGSDPSAEELAELVETVRHSGAKAVFGEAGFSDRFISQLAAETGATFIADLYTDTLTEGPPAPTYLEAMKYNADAIAQNLR
jgi:manganese/iron transport system substrate-binding protein